MEPNDDLSEKQTDPSTETRKNEGEQVHVRVSFDFLEALNRAVPPHMRGRGGRIVATLPNGKVLDD